MGEEWGTGMGDVASGRSLFCGTLAIAMPRQPRLDAFRSSSGTFGPALRPGSSTGTLHPIMVRGIERPPRAFPQQLAPSGLRHGPAVRPVSGRVGPPGSQEQKAINTATSRRTSRKNDMWEKLAEGK
jgi:hypothetical protein